MSVVKGLSAISLSLSYKKIPDNAMSDEDTDFINDDAYFCDISDLEAISGAIFILIFVFSVTGNVLILAILVLGEKLKNITSLFILNLACSDLVFTLTLPFWAYYQLHHWVFGEYACKILTAAYIVGVNSSVILLTALTVDRFVTVVLQWPNDPSRRKRFAVASCTAAWLISAAASVNDAIAVKVETQWNNLSSCEDTSQESQVNLGYYLHVSLLFFLPFTIIVFCYSLILKTVLRASKKRTYFTVVMILCIVAAFFICWGPYNILLIIKIFYKPQTCYAEETLYVAYSICRIIAYSHCCMNPLLYMIPKTSRKHIWSILCCRNSKKKERENVAGQSTTSVHNVAFTVQNSVVFL